MTAAFAPKKINDLSTFKDNVLVTEMNFEGRTLSSGIVLLKDDGKSQGIRPRWGCVYAVGPDQQDVKPGDWICVAHGRWTRGVEIEDAEGNIKTLRRIDPKDILLVSDEPFTDDTQSEAVIA